jgi:hypothetical protein
VAVVDVSTDRLVDAVPAEAGLRGLPMGLDRARDLMVMGTRLVVTAEAGVVELDPAQPAARMLVSADQLGGAPGPVALVSNRIGFAAVETADGHRVVPVDLLKSQVGAPLAGLSGGTVSDLAIDEGRLVVADRGSFDADLAAGIYLYDVGTHERLHGPLRVGHKPLRLAVVAEQRITAVASSSTSPATDEGSRLQPAFPNPFNATLIVPFVLSREMAVRLSVTDALGRRVRRLHAGILPVGSHRRIWDGRDDEGRRVASGVYVARLSTDDGISAQRLLHLR